jgi:hypothetical protein
LNYDKGQTVYIGLDHVDPYRRRNENIRVPVVIESGFLGRDGREWYVYERPSKDGNLCHYGVAPYAAFYDSEYAESNFTKLMKDPVFARQSLQRAGILDANGELSEHYREQ